MSIDFGTDIYEEPLVAKTLLPEDNAEVSLRPHTLAEYIGQTKAKENLVDTATVGAFGRTASVRCDLLVGNIEQLFVEQNPVKAFELVARILTVFVQTV